ncbi:unnamed protein product [Eruca vesicaria subsp. sativa]|uniref:Mediator complex subunit 15 KIX domain-containing protein n=1 Tax=Eruca vesicaria subsp. sativa TaxID=29727 RepID=A0ABC8LCK1_ERUVS|nr:unnamed protein product [Eruca vesicaria subsp. sativa]
MDTNDWGTQLPSDSRPKIVNKIMKTMHKHLPYCGPEGMNELRRIASRFEDKIFNGAVNQTDYLRKISMKMLTMETKSQNPAGSSSLTIPGGYSSLPLNPGYLMDNNNCTPSLPKCDTAMDTCDWRAQLPSGAREKIVNKIMKTMHNHLPYSGPEGMNELRRIASRFEDKIFNGAVNQTDYLRKISMKMLTMETKSQNAAGSSSSLPIPGGYSSLPLNPGRHQMKIEVPVKAEPVVNTCDWRTCLPPDSRNKNANKIKGTLMKHVPNCGKEGNKELERIAASFEELIFNTAIDQVDYLHKTSFKITP